MTRVVRFAAAMGLIAAIACATVGGLQQTPLTAGTTKNFSGDYATVLKATREAVTEAGLHINQAQQMDSTTWMIIGQKDASEWSWGELVRVVVQQTAPTQTVVRVISARRVTMNITARGDYAESILSAVTLKLNTPRP